MFNPAAIAALVQGGGALYNTFNRNNPGKAANPALSQIPGYGRDAYNPFIQSGQQAQQQLSPQYEQMASNPVGQYNDIMSQYEPSSGFQYRKGQLNKDAHNTAASGGFAGTDNDIDHRSELFDALLSGDMQQFMQNILGIKGAGMQGLEGQASRGYNASGNLADYLGSAAGQQAGFDAYGQNESNTNRNEGLANLIKLISGGQQPAFEGGFKSLNSLNSNSGAY